VTGSYRPYKALSPNRLGGDPEVGGVAPVKYSVGLRPPSVFDAPLRFVSRHLVCVLQARCLRVTCRFTSVLGQSMRYAYSMKLTKSVKLVWLFLVIMAVIGIGVFLFEKSKSSKFDSFVLGIQPGRKATELFMNKDGFNVSTESSSSTVDGSMEKYEGKCTVEYNGIYIHKTMTLPMDPNGVILKNPYMVNIQNSDF